MFGCYRTHAWSSLDRGRRTGNKWSVGGGEGIDITVFGKKAGEVDLIFVSCNRVDRAGKKDVFLSRK